MKLGKILFFTGPMYCGKTLALLRYVDQYESCHVPTVCIQPVTNTREADVRSRVGLNHGAKRVRPHQINDLKAAAGNAHVIAVDEAHFFGTDIVPILVAWMREGRIVLVSGLDADFRGEAFPVAVELFKCPEVLIRRLRAACNVCRKRNASRSQRLVDGKPASASGDTILVDGSKAHITYEARCIRHHVVVP